MAASPSPAPFQSKTRPRTADTHLKHLAYLKAHPDTEMIMLGSSHFERFLTTGVGLLPLEERKICVAGVGGDQVEHMMWRVENGLFDGTCPKLKKVLIVSGANNLTNGQNPRVVALKAAALVDMVREKVGNEVVIEFVVPPLASCTHKKIQREEMGKRFVEFGKYMKEEMDKREIFLHPFHEKTFTVTGAGVVTQCSYLFDDEVHLNRRGYELFASFLFPHSS
jgi:hypothetical protein